MLLICSKCKNEKEHTEFYKSSRLQRGFSYNCKVCEREANKINYHKHREKRLEYDRNRKEKKKEYWQNWKKNNPEKYKEHVLKCRKSLKSKITKNVLRRMRHALMKYNNIDASIEFIGCSIDELIKHIEKQFKDNMSWDRYSNSTWHIEHIIPCNEYDLGKDAERLKCFNYNNMRPLDAKSNHSKHAKIDYKAIKQNDLFHLMPELKKKSKLKVSLGG